MREAEPRGDPCGDSDRPVVPGSDQPADSLSASDLLDRLLVLRRDDGVAIDIGEAERVRVAVARDDGKPARPRRAEEPYLGRTGAEDE